MHTLHEGLVNQVIVTPDIIAFQYLFYSDPYHSMVEEEVNGYTRSILNHRRGILQLFLANQITAFLALRLLELEGEVPKPQIWIFLRESHDLWIIHFKFEDLIRSKILNLDVPSNATGLLPSFRKLLRCSYDFIARDLEGVFSSYLRLTSGMI